MKAWWERFPGRLTEELDALAELGLDFYIEEEEQRAGRIVLHGAAPAGRLGLVEVSIVYPGSFPHLRPTVYQVSGPRLSRHQNPVAGNYCLLGAEEGSWQPDMHASDLLDGLPGLVELVETGGAELTAAEDPQGEPVTTYYATVRNGCILVREWVDGIPAEATHGKLTVRFNTATPFPEPGLRGHTGPVPTGQGLLVEMTDQNGSSLGVTDPRAEALFAGDTWTGRWVRWSDEQPPPGDPAGFARAAGAVEPRIARPGTTRSKGWNYAVHAVLFSDELRQNEYGQSLVFIGQGTRRAGKENHLHHQALISGQRFGRESLRQRISHLSGLGERSVGLLGLGTLGAPFARSMAQAQIGRLGVADCDTADIGASVRWSAGVPSAGIDKVAYVVGEVRRHYPFVDVTGVNLRLGSTPPPGQGGTPDDMATLFEFMQDADLVVDATATEEATRAFADVATELCVPQIYLWGVDGYGGVVALIEPGRTGCYHCLTVALADGGHIPPPPSAPAEVATRVQARGCGEVTFIAAACDLDPLVSQATRLAFAHLTGEDGYGTIDRDVHVLRLRDDAGRLLPAPEWASYDLPPTAGCWYCDR